VRAKLKLSEALGASLVHFQGKLGPQGPVQQLPAGIFHASKYTGYTVVVGDDRKLSVEPPEKLGKFQREHPELCAWRDLEPIDTNEIERVFPGLSLTAGVKEAHEEAGRSATADTVGLTKLGALFALETNRDDWRCYVELARRDGIPEEITEWIACRWLARQGPASLLDVPTAALEIEQRMVGRLVDEIHASGRVMTFIREDLRRVAFPSELVTAKSLLPLSGGELKLANGALYIGIRIQTSKPIPEVQPSRIEPVSPPVFTQPLTATEPSTSAKSPPEPATLASKAASQDAKTPEPPAVGPSPPHMSREQQTQWLKDTIAENPPGKDEPMTPEGYGKRIADMGISIGAIYKPSTVITRYYQLNPKAPRRRKPRKKPGSN
jgi:hypothetical protein